MDLMSATSTEGLTEQLCFIGLMEIAIMYHSKVEMSGIKKQNKVVKCWLITAWIQAKDLNPKQESDSTQVANKAIWSHSLSTRVHLKVHSKAGHEYKHEPIEHFQDKQVLYSIYTASEKRFYSHRTWCKVGEGIYLFLGRKLVAWRKPYLLHLAGICSE